MAATPYLLVGRAAPQLNRVDIQATLTLFAWVLGGIHISRSLSVERVPAHLPPAHGTSELSFCCDPSNGGIYM